MEETEEEQEQVSQETANKPLALVRACVSVSVSSFHTK